MSIRELSSKGFGGWGHSRSYVSEPVMGDGYIGAGWRIGGLMYLVLQGTQVLVASESRYIANFTNNGNGTYTNTQFYQETLIQDSVNHLLILTDTKGARWEFHDFSGFTAWPGKLRSYRDPAGNLTSYTYSSTAGPTLNKLIQAQTTQIIGANVYVENWAYQYHLAGVSAGLLQRVALSRTVNGGGGVVIRKVEYTYYPSTTSNGPVNSLQWAKVMDGANNVIETFYHRYNSFLPTGQLPLRYMLGPTGYERAKAALGSEAAIDAASDTTLSQWAHYYFEYDTEGRVTKEVVQGKGCGCGSAGGKGAYTYTYTAATHGQFDGPNTWKSKTVETLPDGNQNIQYFNGFGAVMLSVFKDVTSGQEWKLYFQFDSSGREVLRVSPAGVTGYSEAAPGLVTSANLSDTAGLYEMTSYYTVTGGGQVAGYMGTESCKAGETGTSILKKTFTYETRVGSSGTIYPLNEVIVYENTNGTGAVNTNFDYTWHGSTNQILQRTVNEPTVTPGRNGVGFPTSIFEQRDIYGRPVWRKDQDGFIHATEYDPLTGAVTKQIVDVNTSLVTNEPSGWVTPAGGGLHLTTTYRVDAFGRMTKLTDPNGNVTFTIYKDPSHEMRVYPGWIAATNTTTGPTRLSREDRLGSYNEMLTMSATPANVGGEPTGAEAVSSIQSLIRDHLDTGDRVMNTDSYFSFSGLTYSTSANLGTQGTHFYRQSLNYDAKGRQDRDLDWTQTVRRTIYNSRDQVKSEWVGTDDIPTSGDWSPTNTAGTNLIKMGENEYDAGAIGDGTLTKAKKFTSASVSLDTDHQYDFRRRRVQSRRSDKVAVKTTYDNLDRPTLQETYADTNSDFVIGATELRGKSESKFDERSMVYQTVVHNVNPTTGAIGNRLTTNGWYNARGRGVKVRGPNGEFQKTAYDGAGRRTASFVSFHDAESAYADADDVVGDTVVAQTVTSYDAAGNTIQTTSYARTNSSAKTGDLSASWVETDSRRTYGASWFDAANRVTSVVDYGRNGGTALSRPPTAPAPNTSDAYIVTKTDYDAGGRAYRSTNNKARITETTFDLLGRSTKTVENYVDGAVGNAEYDSDRTTEQIYDSFGRLSQLKARNPKGTSVEDQFTTYVYGTDANVATPAVYRNDLLVGEIYPDSDDTYNPGGAAGAKFGNGTDATYDRVELTYDYASRKKTWKLQLTTLHTYVYDSVGRLSQDQATTLGSGIDGGIRRIVYAYDDLSRRSTVSSYSTATGGTLLNQVAYTYDGWGNETGCTQGHEGTAAGAPGYTKTFVDGAVSGEAKYVRQSSATYPNGRIVYRNFPATGTVGDKLSRLDNLANDASGTLKFAQYTYLGGGNIVKIAHPQVTGGLNLDYGTGTGNPAGFDEFGRIDDQKWQSDAAVVKDRYQYGYDRTSNRTFRDNLTATAKDELFVMDGLDRMVVDKRGDLNAGRTDITGTPAFQETWTLEGFGNWTQLVQTTSGTTTLNQTRTHTKANETTTIAATVGTNWGDGVLDRNGNMTRVPKVDSLQNQRWRLTYDAWGRLVRVVNDTGAATVAEYKYDGLHRRTVKLTFLSATNWDRRDYYYSCDWQVVEERELLNQTSKTVVATLPRYQIVWDIRYIDAIVLRDENKDGDGDCVDGTDQRLYYCQDANFNVTALTDTAGTVVERVQYDAYGKRVLFQADWTTSQAATVYGNEVLFSGYRQAPESGMYQVRHREYHPGLGRWDTRDLLGYHDGMSLYQYVGGNPQGGLDPSGLLECCKKVKWVDGNNVPYETQAACINGWVSSNGVPAAWVGALGTVAGLILTRGRSGVAQGATGAGGGALAVTFYGWMGCSRYCDEWAVPIYKRKYVCVSEHAHDRYGNNPWGCKREYRDVPECPPGSAPY